MKKELKSFLKRLNLLSDEEIIKEFLFEKLMNFYDFQLNHEHDAGAVAREHEKLEFEWGALDPKIRDHIESFFIYHCIDNPKMRSILDDIRTLDAGYFANKFLRTLQGPENKLFIANTSLQDILESSHFMSKVRDVWSQLKNEHRCLIKKAFSDAKNGQIDDHNDPYIDKKISIIDFIDGGGLKNN